MQTYFSDLLARERIAEFRREAQRDRLAALTHPVTRTSRRRRSAARRRQLLEHQPKRATA
jgi:hypothetical protein